MQNIRKIIFYSIVIYCATRSHHCFADDMFAKASANAATGFKEGCEGFGAKSTAIIAESADKLGAEIKEAGGNIKSGCEAAGTSIKSAVIIAGSV